MANWTKRLGAEDIQYVSEHLLDALRPPAPQGPTWVMSLAEEHASIYAEAKGDRMLVAVHDDQGVTIGRLYLDAVRRGHWMVVLQDWLRGG